MSLSPSNAANFLEEFIDHGNLWWGPSESQMTLETVRQVVGYHDIWTKESASWPRLGLRESVAVDTGLLLGRGLITPLEVTLLKTPINADSQVVRDLG